MLIQGRIPCYYLLPPLGASMELHQPTADCYLFPLQVDRSRTPRAIWIEGKTRAAGASGLMRPGLVYSKERFCIMVSSARNNVRPQGRRVTSSEPRTLSPKQG